MNCEDESSVKNPVFCQCQGHRTCTKESLGHGMELVLERMSVLSVPELEVSGYANHSKPC